LVLEHQLLVLHLPVVRLLVKSFAVQPEFHQLASKGSWRYRAFIIWTEHSLVLSTAPLLLREKDSLVLISEKPYLEYKNAMFELNKLKNKDF
jgi:antitoxin Phd